MQILCMQAILLHMSKDSIQLKNQLCHPLYSATNALMRAYKPLLEPLKITYPQYLILMALWESDEINIKDISERTYFDSGTLTPLLNKLKEQGFISIKPMPTDKRNKIIALTTKGKKLQEKAESIPKELSCKVELAQKDFTELKRLAEVLLENLKIAEGN